MMNARGVRHCARILGIAALLAAAGMAVLHPHAPAARAATSATVVTIQFDDGNADQYQALGILNAHGMHATFYVNTGVIGDSAHMSWTQLQTLFAAGNELSRHTPTHVGLKKMKTAPARHPLCQEPRNLLHHRLTPPQFSPPVQSFPHG